MSRSIERTDGKVGPSKDPRGSPQETQAVFLDPWLTAKGDALGTLVERLVEETSGCSSNTSRRPRRDAIQRQRLCVENIAANLASLALSPHPNPAHLLAVATAKSKRTRYDRRDYPRHLLSETLQSFERCGVLTRHPYVFKKRNTTIAPTPAFMELLAQHGVRPGDIGRAGGGEAIWLNARTGWPSFGSTPSPKRLVAYEDTGETLRLRREVEAISGFLNDSAIAFDGEPQPPVALRRMFLLRSPTDPAAFNLNGRLAGGFWMDLRADKRHLITIEGEPIADLDFFSMFAMLAYRRATGRLPSGDPYAVPGLEEHRDAAKLGLLSLLSRASAMKRLSAELRAALPIGWTARDLVAAMARHHPRISHLFGSDIGIELMNTESAILMAVLTELAERGIPALGMHDGINVRQSDRSAAAEAMERVSAQMLSVVLPVREKPVWRPQALAA